MLVTGNVRCPNFPCFLKSNYSISSFPDIFSLVRNNKLMHHWNRISPRFRLQKYIKEFKLRPSLYKKVLNFMWFCRKLFREEENRSFLTKFATEKWLNRDGKAPTKNKNGRKERFEARWIINGKNEPFWEFKNQMARCGHQMLLIMLLREGQ